MFWNEENIALWNLQILSLICITHGKIRHFYPVCQGAFSRASYKLIQNLQISQGYIFRISKHFDAKLWNFTNFNMLFLAVVMDFVVLANLVSSWNHPLQTLFWGAGTYKWAQASNVFVNTDVTTTHFGGILHARVKKQKTLRLRRLYHKLIQTQFLIQSPSPIWRPCWQKNVPCLRPISTQKIFRKYHC